MIESADSTIEYLKSMDALEDPHADLEWHSLVVAAYNESLPSASNKKIASNITSIAIEPKATMKTLWAMANVAASDVDPKLNVDRT